MKAVILLGFVAIIFIAGSIFATQASAQYQGQGGGGQGGQGFQGTRTPVNGTYTNSNFGVQVTLPDGWSGFEMKQTSGNTRVMVASGGYQATQGAPRPPITIGISMIPKSSTPFTPQFAPRNMQGITCTNSTSTNTVNGLNFNEVIVDCSGTTSSGNPISTKAKYEITQTGTANIILSYRANPSSGYDSQVATFDSMVGTFQLANTSQASVVPEFPVPIIGLVIIIMIGTVIVLGRAKIIPSGI